MGGGGGGGGGEDGEWGARARRPNAGPERRGWGRGAGGSWRRRTTGSLSPAPPWIAGPGKRGLKPQPRVPGGGSLVSQSSSSTFPMVTVMDGDRAGPKNGSPPPPPPPPPTSHGKSSVSCYRTHRQCHAPPPRPSTEGGRGARTEEPHGWHLRERRGVWDGAVGRRRGGVGMQHRAQRDSESGSQKRANTRTGRTGTDSAARAPRARFIDPRFQMVRCGRRPFSSPCN